MIDFSLLGAGQHTIVILSTFPKITDPVRIAGETAVDFDADTGTPAVRITAAMGALEHGLWFDTPNILASTVQGLAITDFEGDGIHFENGNQLSVLDSYIGLDLNGNAIGNGNDGIEFASSGGVQGVISNNVISGNDAFGVRISSGATSPAISENKIGTDPTGMSARANGSGGIDYQSTTVIEVGPNNIISGNLGAGIRALNQVSGSSAINDNFIGVAADGVTKLANVGDGIRLQNSRMVAISDNVISGNTQDGIRILGVDSFDLDIRTNKIGVGEDGLTVVGNEGNGIEITQSANDNFIFQNVIANNDLAGIAVTTSAGIGNRFSENSIFDNGGLGIDLGTQEEVLANDNLDLDSGPNDRQNFPEISSAIRNPVTGVTEIRGTLSSSPFGDFNVELFASDSADPLGHGEAQTFLVGFEQSTDASGNSPDFFQTIAGLSAGQFVSATAAVDLVASLNGSTSELSAAVMIVDDPPPYVQNVIVKNTTNLHADHNFLNIVGSGEQLRTIPIGGGINEIEIEFTEDVTVTLNSLRLQGDGGAATGTLYTPDSVDTTDPMRPVWHFNTPIGTDQLLLTLKAGGVNAVVDSQGIPFDGFWDNPDTLLESDTDTFPSGDDMHGVPFQFRMTVLLGDGNLDNIVGPDDYVVWANGFGNGTTFEEGD